MTSLTLASGDAGALDYSLCILRCVVVVVVVVTAGVVSTVVVVVTGAGVSITTGAGGGGGGGGGAMTSAGGGGGGGGARVAVVSAVCVTVAVDCERGWVMFTFVFVPTVAGLPEPPAALLTYTLPLLSTTAGPGTAPVEPVSGRISPEVVLEAVLPLSVCAQAAVNPRMAANDVAARVL